MTWGERLDKERAEIDEAKRALIRRQEAYRQHEEDFKSALAAAKETQDRIQKSLEALPEVSASAKIETPPTNDEERFQVWATFSAYRLIFNVTATLEGGEVTFSYQRPPDATGEVFGQPRTVPLAGATAEFVQERVKEFLKYASR